MTARTRAPALCDQKRARAVTAATMRCHARESAFAVRATSLRHSSAALLLARTQLLLTCATVASHAAIPLSPAVPASDSMRCAGCAAADAALPLLLAEGGLPPGVLFGGSMVCKRFLGAVTPRYVLPSRRFMNMCTPWPLSSSTRSL